MVPLHFALLALMSLAQDPMPPSQRDVPAPPRQEQPALPRKADEPQVTPDPRVEAWANELIARLGDTDPAIARSAEVGLIALGPQAVPALRKAADGAAPESARRARHALEEIRLGPPRFRHPGGPGGPFGPPRGREDRDGGPDDRRGPPPPRDGSRSDGSRGDGPRDPGQQRDSAPQRPPRPEGPQQDGPRRDGGFRPDGPQRDFPREAPRRGGPDRDGPRREGPLPHRRPPPPPRDDARETI